MIVEAYIRMEFPFGSHEEAESAIQASLGFPRNLATWRNRTEGQTQDGLVVSGDDVSLNWDSQVVVYELESESGEKEEWAVCYG